MYIIYAIVYRMKRDFPGVLRVHFAGIGGIGMSALARMLYSCGKEITGSDRETSNLIESLVSEGISVKISPEKQEIPEGTELLIHTIALSETDPVLLLAKELNIPVMSYPEALGQLSSDYTTVAVSGTHGKTTTTAMISDSLIQAGLDPTVIVGSVMNSLKSNFRLGKSKFLIVEACEYKRSFLHLNPDILIITNIEEDHLDYYKDLSDIQKAFSELVQKIPDTGYVVCNPNLKNVSAVLSDIKAQIVDYSKYKSPDLPLPGEHNKENAKTAIATSEVLGLVSIETSKTLEKFQGTWRRFQIRGSLKKGSVLIDDYAHHPQAISETLKGIKEKYPTKKIRAVFQPHLFSRTIDFFQEFAEALQTADSVLIAPIYAAREVSDGSISSMNLAKEINRMGTEAFSVERLSDVKSWIVEKDSTDSIIISMGAGDISSVSDELVSEGVVVLYSNTES